MTKELIKKAEKLAGDTSGVLTELARTSCDLVASLLGSPFRVAGNLLSDQLVAWQWKNRVRIMRRAKEIVSHDDDAIKVLSGGFLLRFLDGAGNIEEPTLQEMWAQLLASSVRSTDAQHPMYVSILQQLGPEDALFLRDLALKKRSLDNWSSRDSEGIAERLLTLNLLAPVLGAKSSSDNPTPTIFLRTAVVSAFGKRFVEKVVPEYNKG